MTHVCPHCNKPYAGTRSTVRAIAEEVARKYGLSHAELISRLGKIKYASYRAEAMYRCVTETRHSLSFVATHFGDRDPSGVVKLVKRYRESLQAAQ